MERDFVPRTLDAPAGEMLFASGGHRLEAADRAKLLADVRAGKIPAKLTVEAVVFRQTEATNRNAVRFKPGVLRRLAKTFEGMPFLRDHAQGDLLARGGTIIKSEFIGSEGHGEIRQTLELVKPWAIEAALDGTISTFSIGWNNTADVLCSECEAPMARGMFGAMPGCSHFPGDRVLGRDGNHRTVEMLVTGADGVETSAVNAPAVSGTGIEGIRQALAAERVRFALAHHQEKPMRLITQKLGLSDGADEASVLAAVTRIQTEQSAELASHAQTKTALAATKGKLEALEVEAGAVKLESLIEGAYRDGRIVGEKGKNDLETAIRGLAALSFAGAEAFVGTLPKGTVPVGAPISLATRALPEGRPGELTAQQKKIAKQLGVTEAAYLEKLEARV